MQLRKPDIDKLDKARKFAKGEKPTAKGKKGKNSPPEGDVRRTMNVDEQLYKRLKVKAAQEGDSIRDVLESLIKAYLN